MSGIVASENCRVLDRFAKDLSKNTQKKNEYHLLRGK